MLNRGQTLGTADKGQIAYMIRRQLPAAGSPTADAADALAVAVTHAHARRIGSLAGSRVA